MSCDAFALARPGVQGLSPYQAGKPIEELQRELGLDHIVKLASNENPLGPSPKVAQALTAASDALVRYPDSNGFELKRALSERLNVAPEQLTLGCGSNDLLDIIARVFLQPGDSAVYSQYAFVVYALSVQACGARALVTPAADWGHDLDAMLQAIDADTKLIFIANPNNPTGTLLDYSAIEDFLAQVPDHVIVVLDEAYLEYNPSLGTGGLALLAQYANLIVTRTFSKAWGLAGLRVGYSIASAEISDLLNRVRAPFNVSGPGLLAATAVLTDDDYLPASQAVNRAGMQQLSEGFQALSLPFIPSYGNFLSVAMPKDAQQVFRDLLQQGVIVRPLAAYGMPDHLRVSVGLEDENRCLLDALKKVLA